MGKPDHLPASWEICMQVKKQQLEQDMEQQTGFKLGTTQMSFDWWMDKTTVVHPNTGILLRME